MRKPAAFLLALLPLALSAQFVRVDGRDFKKPDGSVLHMRGTNLGNWLVPEGYMWRFGRSAQSPREIEAAFERLVGADKAEEFWQRFRRSFITETDIARIAAAGYDHVRLPINARVVQGEDGKLLPDGVRLIDDCLEWCRRHDLYLLLDLHGAPGGQTGTPAEVVSGPAVVDAEFAWADAVLGE